MIAIFFLIYFQILFLRIFNNVALLSITKKILRTYGILTKFLLALTNTNRSDKILSTEL